MNEPYESSILENQLDNQAKKFINDPKNTFFKGDTLFISKIFEWFKEDFSDNPLLFIQQYASMGLKSNLNLEKGNITIKHLDYDWSLNR